MRVSRSRPASATALAGSGVGVGEGVLVVVAAAVGSGLEVGVFAGRLVGVARCDVAVGDAEMLSLGVGVSSSSSLSPAHETAMAMNTIDNRKSQRRTFVLRAVSDSFNVIS